MKIEKIILKYAQKYYPDTTKDWSERHRALAMCAEIWRDVEKLYKFTTNYENTKGKELNLGKPELMIQNQRTKKMEKIPSLNV